MKWLRLLYCLVFLTYGILNVSLAQENGEGPAIGDPRAFLVRQSR